LADIVGRQEVSALSYNTVVTAALSGASVRQLAYWRSARSSEPLLAPATYRPGARVTYSFQDVVALRTFVYLRARDVPLQRVRRAVSTLRDLGQTEHLASYTLLAMERDVVWRISADTAVDLTRMPGQHVIAQMVDILSGFRGLHDRDVVPLLAPKPGVRVDPEVRGGYPVIDGTRVPYDLVAALLDDGVAADDVASFYPFVTAEAARGAVAFARYVDEFRAAPVAG
jgi:uncharacterized protein (DUF433 family)/DNA-binding transcriptional MerR regulator